MNDYDQAGEAARLDNVGLRDGGACRVRVQEYRITELRVLSDCEVDIVTGGGRGGRGAQASGGGTVVEIVEISIGEIVATGNSHVTVNIAGFGDVSNQRSGGRMSRR